jgi:hypothetical protein
MGEAVTKPTICLDRNRYVMAVIGWHGNPSLRQRVLEKEDALMLAEWLQETCEEPPLIWNKGKGFGAEGAG